MKKMTVLYLVAVLALLSVSVVLFSCKPRASVVPDGFAGVPWGASKDQIIKTMSEQGYRQLHSSSPGVLQFKGEFAGVPFEILSFRLIADSFCEGSAWSGFAETSQANFYRIVDILSEKNGPPQKRESRSDKDNKGIDYLADESAFWRFVDKKSSDQYSIQVRFSSPNATNKTNDDVDINYYAVSLRESLEERLKKKNY